MGCLGALAVFRNAAYLFVAVVGLTACHTASPEPDFQTRYQSYIGFPLSVYGADRTHAVQRH